MDTQRNREASLREWTFMVFLAGDNNLDGNAASDLSEMKSIGSTCQVALLAQLDSQADKVTRRYELTSGGKWEDDCVDLLPEINCGDPQALIDFVVWACQRRPAKHYALILWNHGSGWKDNDIYRIAQQAGIETGSLGLAVRRLVSNRERQSLFRSSLRILVESLDRGILYDDSSADFLDSIEMRKALKTISSHLGRPLDLLGCDACLMSMIEVGYQLHDLCRVMVGSQEVEPSGGWPYDLILRQLVDEPELKPSALARIIVESYTEYYRTALPSWPVTQSAIDLSELSRTAEMVDKLGAALKATLNDDSSTGSIYRVRRSVQTFTDYDYVDLGHLCHLMMQSSPDSTIRLGAAEVGNSLSTQPMPVIAEGHNGSQVNNATGISIYLPARTLSPLYERLEFAKDNAWYDFLKAFCAS